MVSHLELQILARYGLEGYWPTTVFWRMGYQYYPERSWLRMPSREEWFRCYRLPYWTKGIFCVLSEEWDYWLRKQIMI